MGVLSMVLCMFSVLPQVNLNFGLLFLSFLHGELFMYWFAHLYVVSRAVHRMLLLLSSSLSSLWPSSSPLSFAVILVRVRVSVSLCVSDCVCVCVCVRAQVPAADHHRMAGVRLERLLFFLEALFTLNDSWPIFLKIFFCFRRINFEYKMMGFSSIVDDARRFRSVLCGSIFVPRASGSEP